MGAIGNFLLRYNAALLALLFLCKNLETPLVVLIKGYFATYLLIRVSRVRVAGGSPFLFYSQSTVISIAVLFLFASSGIIITPFVLTAEGVCTCVSGFFIRTCLLRFILICCILRR